MKLKPHPCILPNPTPNPCPPPNKRKICPVSLANWHCCNYIQILLHTKSTHITKEKNHQYFQSVISTRKKEYKTYTFLRSNFFFNLLETDHLPLSKAIQLCFFLLLLVFWTFFFFFLQVSVYAGITNFGGYSRYVVFDAGSSVPKTKSTVSKNEKQNPRVFLAESSICNEICVSSNTQCPKATRGWKTRAASSSKSQGKTRARFPPST